MCHGSRENNHEEHRVFEKNRWVRGLDFPSAEKRYLMSTRDIEMQRTIMEGQLKQEQAARSVAGRSAIRVVLSDRSAIDPISYAVLTAANQDDARERMQALVGTTEFQAALDRYRNGIFILFKPMPEWLVDDGVRKIDEHDRSFHVFRDVLKELEIPYVELGEEVKDLQARVAFAKKLISQVGNNASLSTRKQDQILIYLPLVGVKP